MAKLAKTPPTQWDDEIGYPRFSQVTHEGKTYEALHFSRGAAPDVMTVDEHALLWKAVEA